MDELSIKKMYAQEGVRKYSRRLWAFFDKYEDDETWTSEEIKNILIEQHDEYRAEQRAAKGGGTDHDNDSEGDA